MRCLLIHGEELSEVSVWVFVGVCLFHLFLDFLSICSSVHVFLQALRNEGCAWLIIVAERVC